MPLLGRTKYDQYKVILKDDVENVFIEYVLAPNTERAAWQALELSDQRNCTLTDVRRTDEW